MLMLVVQVLRDEEAETICVCKEGFNGDPDSKGEHLKGQSQEIFKLGIFPQTASPDLIRGSLN